MKRAKVLNRLKADYIESTDKDALWEDRKLIGCTKRHRGCLQRISPLKRPAFNSH